jgi:hypothetical protein
MEMAIARPATEQETGAVRKLHALHYAWIVLVVTFATLLMAGGIRGSSGILVVPLETEFHWSRATISFAVAVNMFCYGLVGRLRAH